LELGNISPVGSVVDERAGMLSGDMTMSTASYRYGFRVAHADPLIDRVAANAGNALWLLGRILIGGIFVQSGFEKLMDLSHFTGTLMEAGVPLASVLAPIGAALEFGGGAAVVLGLATRYAALLMMAFVVAATLISHRFWSAPPDEQQQQMIQFAKNVAIFGGFLFVFVVGGSRYSFDRWWRRNEKPRR
jgi:putative oxidoreductase